CTSACGSGSAVPTFPVTGRSSTCVASRATAASRSSMSPSVPQQKNGSGRPSSVTSSVCLVPASADRMLGKEGLEPSWAHARQISSPLTTSLTTTQPACQPPRSEEHTSELQSPYDLVCR